MIRSCAVAIVALALGGAIPASATVLSVTGAGSVAADASCPAPPSPPFDCPLLATGTAIDGSGLFGPWSFSSQFMVFSANPLLPTVFRNGGAFYYNDTSAANNDFFGTFTGMIDLMTGQAIHEYVVQGGTGAFAGISGGYGTGTVSVDLSTFAFTDAVRFVIPLPSTLVLLALGAVAGLATRKRR